MSSTCRSNARSVADRLLRVSSALAIVAGLVLGAFGCEGDRARKETSGANALEYAKRAEALESRGALEDALKTFREAARRHPVEAWPWAGIGRTAGRLGRFRESEAALRRAVRWDSTLVEERVEIARLTLEENRLEEALEWIESAIAAGGETPRLIAFRGRVLAEMGRMEEGTKEIERARARAPRDPEVHVEMVFLSLQADSTEHALAILDGLAMHYPGNPYLLRTRAAVRQALGDSEGVVADLEKVLTYDPYRPRARFELAHFLLEMGEVAKAEGHFRFLLTNSPKHPGALVGMGLCALADGDLEAGERAFREAIRSDPEFAPAYLQLGKMLAAAGSYDEAATTLRKARARAAIDAALWEECGEALADVFLELGESDNALTIARSILTRRPDSEVGRALRVRALAAGGGGSNRGNALERIAREPDASPEEMLSYARWLLEQEESKEAIAWADRCLEARPDFLPARICRAQALAQSGLTDEAETTLHDILSESKDTWEAHLALAELYEKLERYPDVLFHALEGEGLKPRFPEFPRLAGSAAFVLGKFLYARASFERERVLRPDEPRVWIDLGRVELELDHPDEAVECFRRARDLDPQGWRASYMLGLAEVDAGRPDSAIVAYRSVIAMNERIAEAHNNLAWLLADRDLDPVLAEVHARRAAELEPENAQVLGTLGWAQYKNRAYEEAAATLAAALKLSPGDPMKHFMLGVVELDRGKREEARAEIERALQLDPRFEKSRDAGKLLRQLGG